MSGEVPFCLAWLVEVPLSPTWPEPLAVPLGAYENRGMATYARNDDAVEFISSLIDKRRYVLNSDWGERQPDAAAQNAYLARHSWDEYSVWHLGLTKGPPDGTKARYAFVVGDFQRVHRSALIACVYRASEWRHKEVELAAHDLLQHLDATSA